MTKCYAYGIDTVGEYDTKIYLQKIKVFAIFIQAFTKIIIFADLPCITYLLTLWLMT